MIYEWFGNSGFAEVDFIGWDAIAAGRLVRASSIALFTAGDLLHGSLELWGTRSTPHYDLVHMERDVLVARFVGCRHRLIANPHFGAPEEGV